MMAIFGDLAELLAPMWLEILFVSFFLVGFAIAPLSRSGKKGNRKAESQKSALLHKQIEADVEAGHAAMALKTWHAAKALAPVPVETLKSVAQSLLKEHPESLVKEVIEHLSTHSGSMNQSKSANIVLDVVARAGCVDLLDELANEFLHTLHIQPNVQTYEALLGGYASVGNEQKVAELCSEMQEARLKLTARGYSLTIKGFLKNGIVDAALQQIQDMHQKGFCIPSFAIAQLFRTACQNDRSQEVFEAALKSELQFPQDALAVLLEDCCKRNDLALARRADKVVQEGTGSLNMSGYDSLLKIYAANADVQALQLFQKMQKDGVRISEGLCVGLLARCADTKFLRFAEEIVSFVRSQNKMSMSIACYSALMKVYAYCGMYDKACDLYDKILSEGLEPDAIMYGCLMKFSVECGRTELSQKLFDKSPTLDIQSYMSLIRAAGRDKDIDRAFAVLEKLKKSGVSVDTAAYNCVVDACVSVGDMTRARAVVSEMQTVKDIVTYNILMKGYCSKGDVHGAKAVFVDMDKAGLAPDEVSYNCLINAAVKAGNFREAWNTIDMMERNGVAVDHYTISIMMKASKHLRDSKEVVRTLELLDRSGINVCADEVLLNTVLETCTRHRQVQRMESIIKAFTNSKLRPSVHTYGALIKACSTLKQMDKCMQLWHMMVDECALEPNQIVMGCMLDALACNGKVEDAVALLNKWKSKVQPNTIMYSTIIKGFANSRMPSRAMDMWKEMCQLQVPFNTVVYNTLIDSQARAGFVEEVSMLVKSMEAHGCFPDAITYSTIVKCYCVKGDLDKAFDVFRTMERNGLAVDSIVYNTLMDGCTKHGRFDLVDLVLESMEKFNIMPSNFTLLILVKMYGRQHKLDKAFEVVAELTKKHRFQVNDQVRSSLMCSCLGNNNPDRAMKVFKEIKEVGGGADLKVYTALLSGLTRGGHLHTALSVVEEAYGLGPEAKRGLPKDQRLDEDTLEQLVRSLSQKKLMESLGVPLFERLRAAQVPISARIVASVFHQSRSGHPWSKASQ